MAIKRGGGMMAQGHGTTSAPRQMLPPQETGGKDERTGGRSKTPTSNQQPEDGTKAGIHKRMQPCKSKDYGTTKTCNIPTTARKSDHQRGTEERFSNRCRILELNKSAVSNSAEPPPVAVAASTHPSHWPEMIVRIGTAAPIHRPRYPDDGY